MQLSTLLEKLDTAGLSLPVIKEGRKIKGIVLRKTDSGVLVSCEGGLYTGIILSKEVKDLERNGTNVSPGAEVEAEILNTNLRHEEGYFIISVSKLLQYDIRKDIIAKADRDEIFTVIPTEANLGGLLIDMHGIKGFIPLSQLAPVNYPRVEDGDTEKIFEKLIGLIGKEFRVRVLNVDEDDKRVILSEREALREEREKIMSEMAVGKEYDGIISGISSYGFFVTIGGAIEGLVHISEITYGHVNSIDRLGKVGEAMKVQIIGLEDGKISLSAKKLKKDPWSIIPEKFHLGDVIQGEVVRYVPYGVFVRMYDDINGLIHLSELALKPVHNPAEVVQLGQVVKAKVILIDLSHRKIGLSIKALLAPTAEDNDGEDKKEKTAPKAYAKPKTYVRPDSKAAKAEEPKEEKE